MLAEAAGASGFLNAAPDPDGILRRVPLVVELDGRLYPSLALAAVASVTGARDMALYVSTVNAASLTIDERIVPLDGKSNLLARYRGKKGTFAHLSAADVMTGDVSPGTLRDKVVFVGTTALGTREVVATPLDTLFAGVEVQATVADNLLRGDFVARPAAAGAIETELVIVEEDGGRAENRAGEDLVPSVHQRALDEVKDRNGMIQDASFQVATELDDIRAELDHSSCSRRLRMNHRSAEVMHRPPRDGTRCGSLSLWTVRIGCHGGRKDGRGDEGC